MVTIKNWCYPIAMILAVGFAALSVYLFILLNQAKKETKTAEKTVDKAVQIIKRTTDSKGQNHVVFKDRPQEITRVQAETMPVIKGTLDTAARALDIQAKQIEQWQRIALTSQARELQARAVIDSLKKLTYFYKNKWIELTYTPGLDSLNNPVLPGTFGYKYNVALNQTQYLKKNQRLIDVFADDTNARINGVERLTIKPKPKFFSAGMLLNNFYVTPNKTLYSGLKVEADLGRVNLSGAKYYNFGSGKFETHYGLGFRLLKY